MGIKNVDIAKMLNISTAAVSFARNNKPGVSDETRRSVEAIIEQYQAVHSSSKSQKNPGRGILFVVHKKHGQVMKDTPFFIEMMECIQKLTVNASYELTTLNYSSSVDPEQLLSLCNNPSISGILLLASEIDEKDFQIYSHLNKPLIVVDAHFPNINANCVGIDNEYLVNAGVNYALKNGHRDIGFLASSVFTYNFEERLAAYHHAMEKEGVKHESRKVAYLHCTADLAYDDMKKYLQKNGTGNLPTCFVAGNDLLAIGAIKALKEFGVRVPEDVSIIGFDDMPIVTMIEPPLTSLHFSVRDICKLAIYRLLQLMNEDDTNCFKLDVRGELVIRKSVQTL